MLRTMITNYLSDRRGLLVYCNINEGILVICYSLYAIANPFFCIFGSWTVFGWQVD